MELRVKLVDDLEFPICVETEDGDCITSCVIVRAAVTVRGVDEGNVEDLIWRGDQDLCGGELDSLHGSLIRRNDREVGDEI